MSAREQVDEAIDSYRGDALEAVLIGSEIWPQFLVETGLRPVQRPDDDVEVIYRGIPCMPSVTPNQINLLIGE